MFVTEKIYEAKELGEENDGNSQKYMQELTEYIIQRLNGIIKSNANEKLKTDAGFAFRSILSDSELIPVEQTSLFSDGNKHS